MSNHGKALLVFAWTMEIIGVTGGALNSGYTTFGDKLPETLLGYLPAIPMAALAMAEMGRVPLASVVYHKHKMIQCMAVLGILALGYLAVENWTFGFERIVDLRLKSVNMASRDLTRADFDLAALQAQRDQAAKNGKEKREELRIGLGQWDERIVNHTTQLGEEAKSHQQNLTQIREACRLIKERCMVPRSKDEDERYSNEIFRLNAELTHQRLERNKLQSELQELTKDDADNIAALERGIASAAANVNDHRQSLRIAADGNQIYRLAASWYGVNVAAVTAEQFANARLVFATFSSIAVALAGSVAALVYYARSRTPGTPSDLAALVRSLLHARRAYYARKRKPLIREVLGPQREVYREGPPPPIVIEKEVPRFIDRVVLIPRFGIRFPVYINRLFGEGSNGGDSPPDISNVTAFSKRGA
jgi:hypothetical protein